MTTGKIVEGDNVLLRGEVARVDDDGDRITVRIKGYGIPVTLERSNIDLDETAPPIRDAADRRSTSRLDGGSGRPTAGNVHLVLAFVGSEFSQHDRRRSVTGLKRCHQTRDVVPMLADYIGTNTLAEKRRDRRIVRRRCDRDQPSIRKVAQSRTEAEPKHGAERKHVIGCPAGVSVVLRYGEIASMMEEPVKDSRIIAALDTSPSMLYRVRKQLVEEGLEAVLSRKQRATPAVARIFDGEKEAKLIALACSKPPKGRARWTLRLLENKVVELGIVARASDSTIGRTLKKTRSSRIAGSAG